MKTLTIRTDALRAALLCAGKKDVRGYLNGVHIVADRVEATNGHVAFIAWQNVAWRDCEPDEMTMARDELAAVVKAAKVAEEIDFELTRTPREPAEDVRKIPDHIAVVAVLPNGARLPVYCVSGDFPDFARLTHGELKPVQSIPVSGKHVELAGTVACTLAGKGISNAQLDGESKRGALWYSFAARVGTAGLMMMPLPKAQQVASTWPGARAAEPLQVVA